MYCTVFFWFSFHDFVFWSGIIGLGGSVWYMWYMVFELSRLMNMQRLGFGLERCLGTVIVIIIIVLFSKPLLSEICSFR